MFNREINSLTKSLASVAKGNYDNPTKFAAIMIAVKAVGEAIQQHNPKFDLDNCERTVRGF